MRGAKAIGLEYHVSTVLKMTDKVQSKITVSEETVEEFKQLVKDQEGKVKGGYSRHVERAMKMYITRQRGSSREKKLDEVSRRVTQLADEVGNSPVHFDAELVVERLDRILDDVPRERIEKEVEAYLDYPVSEQEVITSVTQRLMQEKEVGKIADIRRWSTVTIEGRVTVTFYDSDLYNSGYIADRTGNIRFRVSAELDDDVKLEDGVSYRLDDVRVVERSQVNHFEDRRERLVLIEDEDDFEELDTEVAAHGAGNFQESGIVTKVEERASTPGRDLEEDEGREMSLVVSLDTGTEIYRTRLDEETVLQKILDVDEVEDREEAFSTAKNEVVGKYYTVRGFWNESTDSREEFSGVVAGTIHEEMDPHFQTNLDDPRFPGSDADEPLPAVRAFIPEIEKTKEVVKKSDERNADEYASDYFILPTGHRAGRLLVMGVVTRAEKRGGSVKGYLTDATGSSIEFFVSPDSSDPGHPLKLHQLWEQKELPTKIAVVGSIREGNVRDRLLSARRFVEVDDVTEDTWIRETLERTRTRAEKQPYDTEYEVSPEAVVSDVEEKLVRNGNSYVV